MPRSSQGDVFERLRENDVAIVFDHVGFNQMAARWRAFKESERTLGHVRDPFSDMPNESIYVSAGKWLWFVPEREDHGMTDRELEDVLDRMFSWVRKKRLGLIVTNGISDVDHGVDTDSNLHSDDQRAQLLIHYSQNKEKESSITIELVSLNDVFVRNASLL